jgi:5-methyltetrahydrofolate--homocysteine methyltransferase
MDYMVDIVKEMLAVAGNTPILVHANAGLPQVVNGVDTFPEGPEETASKLTAVIQAGARIVGGCCGTTPAHIRAMRQVVDGINK